MTKQLLRRHARRLVALAIMGTAYAFTRLPSPHAADRVAAIRAFHFEAHDIAEPAGGPPRHIRAVHPSLRRIDAWISAVGAAVALADLDGTGRPDGACLVDPRSDQVVLTRVGGAAEPIALDMRPWVDPSTMAPMGCQPGDFNEDGRLDLLVYFWGRPPLLFVNRGGPVASRYVAQPLVDSGDRWFTNAVVRADLDGDGHADLVIANYFPDGAAILDAAGSGVSAMQDSMSRARNGGQKHVFLWTAPRQPDGVPVFRRVPDALPADAAGTWTLALAAADLDGDQRPELYFANDFGPDVLLHNDSQPGRLRFSALHGRRRFGMPRSKVLGEDSFKGMGVDVADLNHDDVPDLFVSNIASTYALEESHFLFMSAGSPALMRQGIAPYDDRSEALGLSRSGWSWDAKLDDFNDDGVFEAVQAAGFLRGDVPKWAELQELATGNDQLLHDPRAWPRFQAGADLDGHDHNPFFVRHGDGRYYDVAPDVGLGQETASRGIAIADIDGDGLLDMAIANQWAPPAFYANRSPRAGAFVGLRLLRPVDPAVPFAVTDGRPAAGPASYVAIGAVARLRTADGERWMREVDDSNGHSGKRSGELLFGLGTHAEGGRIAVELRWRDADGHSCRRELTLTPGWHTVLLGR